MAAYVLIADGVIPTSLRVIAAVPAFMNALDASGSSLSRQELQCIVRNCLYGNGFWQFITYSIQAKVSRLFF
jgi:hypothetical protein